MIRRVPARALSCRSFRRDREGAWSVAAGLLGCDVTARGLAAAVEPVGSSLNP